MAYANIEEIISNPRHMQSLRAHAASRSNDQILGGSPYASMHGPPSLLVEIRAAADFFTDNEHLMASPPPVLVDIILDPFLFNILPQSLLPSVGYLFLLGLATWVAGRWVANTLRSAGSLVDSQTKKQT